MKRTGYAFLGLKMLATVVAASSSASAQQAEFSLRAPLNAGQLERLGVSSDAVAMLRAGNVAFTQARGHQISARQHKDQRDRTSAFNKQAWESAELNFRTSYSASRDAFLDAYVNYAKAYQQQRFAAGAIVLADMICDGLVDSNRTPLAQLQSAHGFLSQAEQLRQAGDPTFDKDAFKGTVRDCQRTASSYGVRFPNPGKRR